MFIPLLLIRYQLLFAVHVDLNSKIVIDSHLLLEEKPFYIRFLTFRLLLVTIAEDMEESLKIKNNNRFLSNTRGITLLHSIFYQA